MKTISIFGATGSVGQSAIDLIAREPDAYDVVALTGGQNVALLAADAIRLKAKVAVTCYHSQYDALKSALAGSGIVAMAGEDAIVEAARMPADWALSAIIGAAGLRPSIALAEQGNTIALANKETLVTAGPLLMQTAALHGTTVLPVDSEHSAVFQALVGEDMTSVERVIITASGGAFRDWSVADIAGATVAQASAHPNWDMGQRITIDSASMFNKGMELIETKEFFGVDPQMIEVLVHRESLVHALVGFCDGALMAHVGPADMRHAIGYALHWPDRGHVPVERLNLAAIGQLSFETPNPEKYPALTIASTVMHLGGHAGAVFNAAKEIALDGFIAGKIGFLDMAKVVDETLNDMASGHGLQSEPKMLDAILAVDQEARARAEQKIKTLG